MDYKSVQALNGGVVLTGVKHFIPVQTLDCGQCFRWTGADGEFSGLAHGRRLEICLTGDALTLKDTPLAEFESVWKNYFDFNRDYGEVRSRFGADATLTEAMNFSPGLRLMKQDPWEMLITFILSQQNNIPRIRGLVERLCANFGEEIEGGHGFPSPERLAALNASDLAVIKCGYRDVYILDAARRVAGGETDLNALYKLDAEDAFKELVKIKGVGDKVADCVLLFGYGSLGRVPKDVWMKRVMARHYPNGFDEGFKDIAGIAQQYLFQYARKRGKAEG